jgi:hypothetical protein
VPSNNVTETRVAFNYYHARHGLKWQTDVGVQTTKSPTAAAVKSREFRSQLQFIF